VNGQFNVAQITDKQPQPACKFTITAMVSGFPVEISGEGRAGDLKLIIDRLLSIGAQPPQIAPAQPEPTKPAGVPTCPIHSAPMKPSQKPGAFFCPKKNDDGSYCRHKA
jgi:hypothetical protein